MHHDAFNPAHGKETAMSDKSRPDAIRFYEVLGFVATHEGLKLHLPQSKEGRKWRSSSFTVKK